MRFISKLQLRKVAHSYKDYNREVAQLGGALHLKSEGSLFKSYQALRTIGRTSIQGSL